MDKSENTLRGVLTSLGEAASSLLMITPNTVSNHIEETEKHLLDAIEKGKGVITNFVGLPPDSPSPKSKPMSYRDAVKQTKTGTPPEAIKPRKVSRTPRTSKPLQVSKTSDKKIPKEKL